MSQACKHLECFQSKILKAPANFAKSAIDLLHAIACMCIYVFSKTNIAYDTIQSDIKVPTDRREIFKFSKKKRSFGLLSLGFEW